MNNNTTRRARVPSPIKREKRSRKRHHSADRSRSPISLSPIVDVKWHERVNLFVETERQKRQFHKELDQKQLLNCIKSSCRKLVHYCGLTVNHGGAPLNEQGGNMPQQEQQQQQNNNQQLYNVRRFPKNFKLRKEDLCVACMERPPVTLHLCGHVTFCFWCTEKAMTDHRNSILHAIPGQSVQPITCAICRNQSSFRRITRF
ncbi:unnamed protein product [Meloidogyne enterolobii]|uniref:Uncharacterized protein n=1 Tax=Meloidogyne enterolobii TaxID=390850 RepID=A0ACB1AG69_MELEN